MPQVIDVNVWLNAWPFRHHDGMHVSAVVDRLQQVGITTAWVASFEGVFHRDLAGANARLSAACRTASTVKLVPFGAVNPAQPDWQEDLRRCDEEWNFPGVRLTPSYHGYTLALPGFSALLKECAERKLVVQLATRLEDERTQHPVFRVPLLDLTPLPALIREVPSLRLVLLNALRGIGPEQMESLTRAGQVWWDIAWLEGIDGLTRMAEIVPTQRLLLGSYYPMFYLESALGKLRECDLPATVIPKIEQENAVQLLELRR